MLSGPPLDSGNQLSKVAERQFVAAVAPIVRDVAVILDVHPPEALFHFLVLREGLGGSAIGALNGIENRNQLRRINLVMHLGHQLAVLTDDVYLNLQPERQLAAVANLRP